ncbi:MAG TPA: hypothetical protein VN876_02010 [Gemmatimonadaceae bacterium]|nr:hypothetical protein [Gemmatimonadaceae bacterium]
MKPFQSRVVAAWIVALPIAYALVVQTQHRADRFRTDPQGEVARQLSGSQHISFVGFFVLVFGLLVLLTLVIDTLGTLIERFFPERAESPKSGV